MKPPIPKISVVMPTYNQGEFLDRALMSVLNQTYDDFEIIVVNDGSTDDTPAKLTLYQEKYRHIHVIHQCNKKLAEALNAGFMLAKGEYLTWISSDNYIYPRMLEILAAELARNSKIGLVYADWELINDLDEWVGEVKTFDYDKFLLLRLNYINCCFMYRKACQDEIGLYDDNYRYCEDWEYWLRISKKFEMKHIPEIFYRYRIHQKSLTKTEVAHKTAPHLGNIRLQKEVKRNIFAWYWSKVKFLALENRIGIDPRKRIQPYL